MHVLSSTAVKTFIIVASGSVASTAGHAAGQCGTPNSFLGTRIDASYNPAPGTGGWAEMRNWGDVVLDGSMGDGGAGKYEGGSRDQLSYPVAGGDWYAFALRGPGENPYLQQPTPQKHQPIMLADPSVMRVTWEGETWYFITGTSGATDRKTRLTGVLANDSLQDELAIMGTQLANFIIYRTKDFYHFEPHMLAFREYSVPGQTIGAHREYEVLYVADGRKYIGLQSPHLYIDPLLPEQVCLVFTAVEYSASETPPDVDTAPDLYGTDIFNHTSVFVTKMPLADFMSWETMSRNWYTDYLGPRFTFGPAWYYYVDGTSYIADGGVVVAGHPVPSSGHPWSYQGTQVGQLSRRLADDPPGERREPPWEGRGWGHNGYFEVTPYTWMTEGPYVFVDPNPRGQPNRWMLYDWRDAEGLSQNPSGDLNPASTNPNWGNAVAAHPLYNGFTRPGTSELDIRVFDKTYTTMFVANNRSEYNAVSECSDRCVKNGRANDWGYNWWWGGIAESSCAFYLPSSNCYYVLFSRNGASTAAYQIVYRRTQPGGNFLSLGIGSPTDFDEPESVLLRGYYYWWFDPDRGKYAPPSSYGSPSYFEMLDSCGNGVPYIAFHARLEASPRRVIFFKELSTISETSPDLLQLREERDSPPNRQSNIAYYRIPWCRNACPADINGDGIVDFGDYTEFLTLYDTGDHAVDFTCDGIVDFADYLEFINHYGAGC